MASPSQLSVDEILREQDVSLEKGLDAASVKTRQGKYGLNELEQEERTPLWKLVLEQFEDKLVQILLFAAICCHSFWHFSKKMQLG